MLGLGTDFGSRVQDFWNPVLVVSNMVDRGNLAPLRKGRIQEFEP